MKKNSFQLVGLILLATFVISCSKKDQPSPDPYSQLCTPQSPYYFRGVMDNQSQCWNYSVAYQTSKCELYSGSGSTSINDTVVAYYWMHGIQKSINNGFYESLVISSKTQVDPTTCTRDQFFNSFQVGVYKISSVTALTLYPDFDIYYTAPDTAYYLTSIGKQYDGQIELISVIKKPDPKNICDSAILHYRLRCTLFNTHANPYGVDSLRISIGELTVIQMRLYQARKAPGQNTSPGIPYRPDPSRDPCNVPVRKG